LSHDSRDFSIDKESVMKKHPSGRPIRHVKKGIEPKTHWPREYFVIPRLNHPMRDLAGGFGFRMLKPEDDMYLETRAKK
jgi:hypothetical protein